MAGYSTAEQRLKAIRLVQSGLTFEEAGEAVGFSASAIRMWMKGFGAEKSASRQPIDALSEIVGGASIEEACARAGLTPKAVAKWKARMRSNRMLEAWVYSRGHGDRAPAYLRDTVSLLRGLVSTGEAARVAGVSRDVVTHWRTSGLIQPAMKVDWLTGGEAYLYKTADVVAVVTGKAVEPPERPDTIGKAEAKALFGLTDRLLHKFFGTASRRAMYSLEAIESVAIRRAPAMCDVCEVVAALGAREVANEYPCTPDYDGECVYYMLCTGTGTIKVGVSTSSVEQRRQSHSCFPGHPVLVLGYEVPPDGVSAYELEGLILCGCQRMRGETVRPTRPLLERVRRASRQSGVEDALAKATGANSFRSITGAREWLMDVVSAVYGRPVKVYRDC